MRRRSLLGDNVEYVFSAKTISVSSKATSATTTVKSTANGIDTPYTVVSYESPITAATISSNKITVKFTKNTTISKRTSNIIIKQTESNKTYTITFTQDVPTIELKTAYYDNQSSYTSFSGNSETATRNLTIYIDGSSANTANFLSYISISCVSWLSYTQNGASVTLTVSRNTNTASTRSGTITATLATQPTSKSSSYSVYQDKDVPTITSIPYDGTVDGYKYIEIGGIKWALNNVGATTDGGVGNYYFWPSGTGSTAGPNGYSWQSCPYWISGTSSSKVAFSKYNEGGQTIDSSDDAATKVMGGGWRTPTSAETATLRNSIGTISQCRLNGTRGIKLESSSDSSKFLFMPLAGGANGALNYDMCVWTTTHSNSSGWLFTTTSLRPINPTISISTFNYEKAYSIPIRGVHA